MAPYSDRSPAWLFALAVFTSVVVCPSASFHFRGSSVKGLFRVKRNGCVDGVYEFNGRECCLCPAGRRLKRNCFFGPQDVQCDLCSEGSYNSEPNHETSCKPCTSCDQLNANLEVDEPCTIARNTKCKCKPNHYCSSRSLDGETCLLCQPCKVCDNDDVKTACTGSQDTVCNGADDNEPMSAAATAGIIIAVLLTLALAVATAAGGRILYNKSKLARPENPHQPEEDMLLDDLKPHLSDIVDTLGWNTVERLAKCSNIKSGVIESCKLNHPGNNQAQTEQLLEAWMELQGRDASKKLIEMLNNSGMKRKANEVKNILSKGRARPNSSA